MEKEIQAVGHDVTQLADDARALLAATADVAGDRVAEARHRLAAALERGRAIYGKVREQAADGVKAADGAVHANPYPAIAIGVGLGALAGFLVARGCSCKRD
jgi:ElaB/YqjD/DUF883 family membrane-anchored ribosome-binding protein